MLHRHLLDDVSLKELLRHPIHTFQKRRKKREAREKANMAVGVYQVEELVL